MFVSICVVALTLPQSFTLDQTGCLDTNMERTYDGDRTIGRCGIDVSMIYLAFVTDDKWATLSYAVIISLSGEQRCEGRERQRLQSDPVSKNSFE